LPLGGIVFCGTLSVFQEETCCSEKEYKNGIFTMPKNKP